MKVFVGITDYNWYKLHASNPTIDEVNFWRPSERSGFRALRAGEPFLFKLHSPRNFIVGGGFFIKFLRISINLAWDTFGEANGVQSLFEFKQIISQYRREPIGNFDDPSIGCILLEEPFFFNENEWIQVPANFALNTVQGKVYETEEEIGRKLWQEITIRLESRAAELPKPGPAITAAAETARYGQPVAVRPRLGQGAFRLLMRETYKRKCAFTEEKTLPVLDAAHIRPFAAGGNHELSNGLLLRSDIHKLFDLGYIGVDPVERKIIVSNRIKEEFENGRDYYALRGRRIIRPSESISIPTEENLSFHLDNIFKD